MKKRIEYADDDKEPVQLLLRLRIPSLLVGLVLGLLLSFVTSNVVYLADAVGTQI